MLEGIVADVLVRVLGSYVDGLNKDSIRVGVWRGDLELKNLRLRPDALAVLFETLGLDLPVTVTAGYIGLLRLEVPWKSLRSAPVRIFMHDVTVVASPVSDGDQTALELREKRLKAAKLATDEAVRDAKFSVRSAEEQRPLTSSATLDSFSPDDASMDTAAASTADSQTSGYGVARWGWRFTSRVVTKIVDNIQIDVENVIVQYEDASSVRDRPYTATLALDSLRACSTNHKWAPIFIENPSSPVVHKVIYMRGLVLNWEPGNANNDLKSWILDPSVERTAAQWAGFVRQRHRHAIKPMDGELRIALTKSTALAAALAGKEKYRILRSVPRVQMDLHFPDVKIILDDFQYHTLLSTIMYLSDIDRKVRPTTARGRWLWALDRLLPRFKQRRDAAMRFNSEGLRERREKREKYCKARNAVVTARRKSAGEPRKDAKIVEQLETELSYEDIVLFRDIADQQLVKAASDAAEAANQTSRFWSLFYRAPKDTQGRRSRGSSGKSTPKRSRSKEAITQDHAMEDMWSGGSDQSTTTAQDVDLSGPGSASSGRPAGSLDTKNDGETIFEDPFEDPAHSKEKVITPNFRMGFLLGRGAIVLKEGGFPEEPIPIASLEFGELRLGFETRPGTGLLLEALLGTFQVIDLKKRIKVMYPRAPWSGGEDEITQSNSAAASGFVSPSSSHLISDLEDEWRKSRTRSSDNTVSSGLKSGEIVVEEAHLHSYPHQISNAISDIRGEYGAESGPLPATSPTFPRATPYRSSFDNASSSGSLSGLSDGQLSTTSAQNLEDLSVVSQTPLRYIAALRLSHEEATGGEWATGATRMAMDLAIGGMEVLVDGPKGAFVSSVTFWHPREKMPSIMHFLMRAAAPRLASLRMDIQKALLDRSVPMRMDMLIRGPRFVIPGSNGSNVSLVLDLGTFAMETSTGPPQVVTPEIYRPLREEDAKMSAEPLSIRYTDYEMACSDLGLFVVSEAGKQAAERIIRPFSVHFLLQVLNNSSFVEAMTLTYEKVSIPKVSLQAQLPSMKTSLSHNAFRQILDVVKGWSERSRIPLRNSGIEPNPVQHSVSLPAELEEVRVAHNLASRNAAKEEPRPSSPLIAFEMRLGFEDLQLELRDASSRRVVTVSTTGTVVKMKRRVGLMDFDFRVKTFGIIDGSRGATAPFRQLAYAGIEKQGGGLERPEVSDGSVFHQNDNKVFISLSYRGDIVNREQSLAVKILSLNLVCVRETYFALADFFYLKEKRGNASKSSWMSSQQEADTDWADFGGVPELGEHEVSGGPSNEADEYTDPFAALGTTTSAAARALRHQAGRGMELSKQALANRGTLSVTADLDGVKLTLVSADGAIGSFDVSDCKVRLTQFSTGAVEASGELGGFCVRDLTAAYDVYSETIKYDRVPSGSLSGKRGEVDGWSLLIPESKSGDIWLEARLRNLRIVYLQRFIVILKKYFDALRDSLKPVLEMKGGIGEVFEGEERDEFPPILVQDGRVRVNVVTECIDIVMPRHSQSPYEALRFFVPHSSITNEDFPAPGYRIGFQLKAEGVNAYVLYQPPAEGEGRALTEGGKDPVLRQISPSCPVSQLTPFSDKICIFAKLDAWRVRRVPEVILNADGIPVLKDGQEEKEYNPAKWLPALRVRVSAPLGISARLCEAEYSILYFTFTENFIERPDIEFTDIVRGLKTPVLPKRKPVQPIMFSSNRMPPNYKVLFEVPTLESVIMHGADQRNEDARLIRSELRDVIGSFDYGVDFRMTIEVNGNMTSLEDIRPSVPTHGKKLIMPIRKPCENPSHHGNKAYFGKHKAIGEDDMNRSITFIWDRPFGFRSNVMLVASDLRIIVEPELFRDLGKLTVPGFPFLKSSAPAPLVRFNGRLLIATISRPEIWLMANQYPGDGRSLVIRGDIIAKVQWAAVTGRKMVEVAASDIHMNLSSSGPFSETSVQPLTSSDSSMAMFSQSFAETPMLYPCNVSMKYDGSGYDPPKNPADQPTKVSISSLSVNAESVLVRVDVNDAPLILAVGSKLVRLKGSALSNRPPQPGRFDEWIDKGDEEDAKLSVHFALPHGRLMFTDETAGRYVPIMEARIKNLVVRSNVPWLSHSAFEFALDLFNEEKGWWEPGVEAFPVEIAASNGRSGSQAIHIRTDKNIDLNVTPNTVSGAARVSKALKSAVEDLIYRMKVEAMVSSSNASQHQPLRNMPSEVISDPSARRPSVAAFCVRNETGRPMVMWLPYDSTRRTLRGDGGEVEVDTPTKELLWTVAGDRPGLSGDPNKSRQLSMRCTISLSGYEPVTLSAAETGSHLITFHPDNREMVSITQDTRSQVHPLTVVWSVTMRDGVPCGCIRSILRLVNRTKDTLEVNIGGLAKSMSLSDQVDSVQPFDSEELARNALALVKPGQTWSVPVHSVHRSVRIRPTIFSAPELYSAGENGSKGKTKERGRVYYSYKWSDPLSKLSALQEAGDELFSREKLGVDADGTSHSNRPTTPILTCRAAELREPFCFSILPKVFRDVDCQMLQDENSAWLDIHICPPLVVENLLPRPISFKLASAGAAGGSRREHVVAHGSVEPLREAHIHTAGTNFSTVSIAVGMDNNPFTLSKPKYAFPVRHVGDFHENLSDLTSLPMGCGRYVPFRLKLEQEQGVSTRYVRTYCSFWIRNRSDSDLFFKDHEHAHEKRAHSRPKVFLRGRPPGTVADKFICFSGPWLSFQRATATEDIWTEINKEVSEIDKPMPLQLEGLSLLLEVRPAKGRFQKALVLTIRNAAWLENRTDSILQWCQPAALNPKGIALSSKVHCVSPGQYTALHWDYGNKKKAICLRRASESGSSDWIWSRPVSVDGVEGEFAAKMYRPKRFEQYIARVAISKLGSGVSAVVVHKEDRSTPPYRIVNQCLTRSIAFRQSGVNETYPWLVRPGKTTRYSWDDPQAPVKRRSLAVEVLVASQAVDVPDNNRSHADLPRADSVASELSEVAQHSAPYSGWREKSARPTKFELNIDMIRTSVPFPQSKKLDPPLTVSVHVDGPTKVVTFRDGDGSEASSSGEVPSEGVSRSIYEPKQASSVDEGPRNLDIEVFVRGLGVSFVEAKPVELAYLSISGIHFRLDRFDGQHLTEFQIQDMQLDNQLVHCTWPVVLWSPPPPESSHVDGSRREDTRSSPSIAARRSTQKPFFQFTADGPFPFLNQGIGCFRGVFLALQQMNIAADEDFVLRVWLFVVSLIEAAGGSNHEKEEALTGKDRLEKGMEFLRSSMRERGDSEKDNTGGERPAQRMSRLYVEHLELCPLKLTVSFTSSRTSTAAEQIGGFRSLIRTLVAVLGNVENAEFRINALELQHVFDTTSHFRSLIKEFYVSQASNQKMALLASNSLMGNPSALFDSIAIGTRDFFVEPANAKGSADFIASIGRGSSSLLTHTVGGIVGSLGGIPRAVAQGLETAVGDRDYLAERDSIRGGRARMVSSPAQGLFTGALSFGHGIASGAAGLIRDPIQGAAEEGPSGFIKGLGKGFIGGLLKPITGALDLLAEPAAGFRSMMISGRSHGVAEPVRPPRAFGGVHADRMTPYDMRAALGNAILEAVNGSENNHNEERLQSWTHLVPVHSEARDEDVIMFLWALLRRSTRSSHMQSRYLRDAEGNPQKAEKMRAGLITNKRLVITTLDGHVIWEYPLIYIADTQVSMGAGKDFLMVGKRPVGNKPGSLAPADWEKIHCGSGASRDELNTALRKALYDLRKRTRHEGSFYHPKTDTSDKKPSRGKEPHSHRRDQSVELHDMSGSNSEEAANGKMLEMKSIHQDASVDGTRGVFTSMKLPGRQQGGASGSDTSISRVGNLSQELGEIMRKSPQYRSGAVRSVRLCLVNNTDDQLSLLSADLDSGEWVCEPPHLVLPKSVSVYEADGTQDRVVEISGSLTLEILHESSERGLASSNNITIRFINPMLASNAYGVLAPTGYTIGFKGGERGDHATAVFVLNVAPRLINMLQEPIPRKKMNRSSAEPLLFGRSKISPNLPPVPTHPAKAAKESVPHPEDPELVSKLSSLGFSTADAIQALKKCNGDLSEAYASLIDQDKP